MLAPLSDEENGNSDLSIDLRLHSSSCSSAFSSRQSPNDFYKSFTSKSSDITIDDYASSRFIVIKVTYILVTFTNTFLGLTVFFTHGVFLQSHTMVVYFYLVAYTFLWPISAILGLSTAGIIAFLRKFRIIKPPQQSDLNLTYVQAENVPNYTTKYLIVVFLTVLAFLYTISIPSSIYILYLLHKNKIFYYHSLNNCILYLFIVVNLVKSILIAVLSGCLCLKEKIKKNKIDLDEEFIKQIESEVEQANKYSGIIAPSNNLIKMNNMFNRQYIVEKDNAKSIKNTSNMKGSFLGSINLNNPEEVKAALEINSNIFKGGNKRLSMDRIDTLKNFLSNQTAESKKEEVIEIGGLESGADEGVLTETREDKKTRIKKLIKNKTMRMSDENSKRDFIRHLKSQLTMKNDMRTCTFSKSPIMKKRNNPLLEDNVIALFTLENDKEQEEEENVDVDVIKRVENIDDTGNDLNNQAKLVFENSQEFGGKNNNKSRFNRCNPKSNKNKIKNISFIFPPVKAYDDIDTHFGLERSYSKGFSNFRNKNNINNQKLIKRNTQLDLKAVKELD